MTRINIGINPARLIDQHLIAEYRELPRIFTLAFKRLEKGDDEMKDCPKKFTLGKGHVKFFYDKLAYLENRHAIIKSEMRRRGFQVNFDQLLFPPKKMRQLCLYGGYEPTKRDCEIVRKRLEEVIMGRIKQPRYCGRPITPKNAVNLLRRNHIQLKWLNDGTPT